MTSLPDIRVTIEAAFEHRADLGPSSAPADVVAAVEAALAALDRGEVRVAEKIDGQWRVHDWLKKAVLLSFRLFDNRLVESGYTRFYDKVDLKYAAYDAARFRADGVRVASPATRC